MAGNSFMCSHVPRHNCVASLARSPASSEEGLLMLIKDTQQRGQPPCNNMDVRPRRNLRHGRQQANTGNPDNMRSQRARSLSTLLEQRISRLCRLLSLATSQRAVFTPGWARAAQNWARVTVKWKMIRMNLYSDAH